MDERLLPLVFLLMAGVLPLRALGANWADRPDRRARLRALWVIYLLAAAGALVALVIVIRREDAPRPPPMTGPEQLVWSGLVGFGLREADGSGISRA